MISGYFFIICAAVAWGLIGIFSALAFLQGISPMEVAFWRAILTWSCFGTQAVVQHQAHIEKKDIPLLIVFSLLGISLFYVSYQFAVKTSGAAFASVLLYTAPAWVIVFSFFIYKERITLLKTISVCLVILGVFFISQSSGNAEHKSFGLFASLAGLISGVCYSLYYTIGKYFSKKYTSATLFCWMLPIGALGILPFVEFAQKTKVAWLALILVSFFSTYIANICYYRGLRTLEAGKASLVATLEPVVASIMAYIFFGEYFSISGYMGAGLILTAVLLTIYKN
ncbi:MAG: EamA family transporter [Pseudomonadota bacterium]